MDAVKLGASAIRFLQANPELFGRACIRRQFGEPSVNTRTTLLKNSCGVVPNLVDDRQGGVWVDDFSARGHGRGPTCSQGEIQG